jgi:hypothetical protein
VARPPAVGTSSPTSRRAIRPSARRTGQGAPRAGRDHGHERAPPRGAETGRSSRSRQFPRHPGYWSWLLVVLVVVAVAHRRLGPSSSATTSTVARALPSSAVQARCWSPPTTTTRLPLVRDSGGVLGLVALDDHGEERRLLLPPTADGHPEHGPGDPGLGGADLGVVGASRPKGRGYRRSLEGELLRLRRSLERRVSLAWTPGRMAPDGVRATRAPVPGFRWGLVRSAAL